MSVSDPNDEAGLWDGLDAALARLRECRNAVELAERVGELGLEGCRAEAVSFGAVRAGTWSSWCRAGRVELLDPEVPVANPPRAPRDDPDFDVDVIEGGLRRVTVCIHASEHAWWVLRVVTGADPEIVSSFAAALHSVLALIAVLQSADRQQYVVARLVSGLTEVDEQTLELVDPIVRSRPGFTGAAPGLATAPPVLSARQREVMNLLLRGLSNAEIAERLVLAVPTVKSHVRAILRAAGAVNRADAIARLTTHRSV